MEMSKVLSGRKIQPGTEKFGKPAHDEFLDKIAEYYPDAEVVAEPRLLKNLGFWALIPDFAVTVNGRTALIEIKRQGPAGNAHERLFKYFTPRVMKNVMQSLSASAYPVYAILCDELAVNPRYIREVAQHIDPHEYLLWDSYRPELLVNFLNAIFDSQGTFDAKAFE